MIIIIIIKKEVTVDQLARYIQMCNENPVRC